MCLDGCTRSRLCNDLLNSRMFDTLLMLFSRLHTWVCSWACRCWNSGLLGCVAVDICFTPPPGASRVTTAAGRSKPLQSGHSRWMNSCSQPTCFLEREFSM